MSTPGSSASSAESTARVVAWSSLTTDHPMPKIARQRIVGEHLMLSSVVLEAGFFLASHHHANEQFACVIDGRIRFVIHEGTSREREYTLGPGEVLVIPPNVPHAAHALERTTILDVFSPPSAGTGVDSPPPPLLHRP